MQDYFLLIAAFFGLFLSLSDQRDFRAGHHDMFRKSKVKKNSILRKILPFKDNEENPYLYVKIIPVLIQILYLIIIFCIYIVYWIFPQSISCFFNSIWYYILLFLVWIPTVIWGVILRL